MSYPVELAFQIATSIVAQAGIKLKNFLLRPPECWDLAKRFKGDHPVKGNQDLYQVRYRTEKKSGAFLLNMLSSKLVLGIKSTARVAGVQQSCSNTMQQPC